VDAEEAGEHLDEFVLGHALGERHHDLVRKRHGA
jgi:hypothetical protein